MTQDRAREYIGTRDDVGTGLAQDKRGCLDQGEQGREAELCDPLAAAV